MLEKSPAAEFNDGPASNDGNVSFAADQFLLVAGVGGQYSDLVFTAPTSAIYSVSSSFLGDQYGIGTVVGIVQSAIVIFQSSVTSIGENVPYAADVSLNAGQELVFSVGPGGGAQNTGVSATITNGGAAPIHVTNAVDIQNGGSNSNVFVMNSYSTSGGPSKTSYENLEVLDGASYDLGVGDTVNLDDGKDLCTWTKGRYSPATARSRATFSTPVW